MAGFQLILDEDVKDLMLQFQNDKPTRDEIEKIIEKYSSLNRTFLSAKFDVVLSVLQEIQANTLNQESSNSVHPSGSSVSPTEATSKSKDIQSSKMKGKDPDSKIELRAETAKLSRGTLHKAAINGRCDVIKVLLESGEDVDQTDKFNLTPLHLAAWYGQRAVVKLLLHHGANVNAVDRFQKTALQKAYRNNHRTIVELLLRNKASPSYNQPPSLKSLSEKAFLHVDIRSGFNRLHAAVFHGDYDTFWKTHAYLDNYVQDMSFQKTGSQAKAFPGKTALEILLAQQEKGEGNFGIEKMYKEIVETIDTLTELHLCKCKNDAEKAVEIALRDDVDVNIPGKSNRTPLLWASLSASGEFIQTLMDLGADVNTQRSEDKIASLKLATSWNNYMAVNILLRYGADVNIQDGDGWTPLHSCASRGLLSISQLLIDSGCNINLRSNQGLTSLYLAVRSKNKHLVKCLLEKKADVNVKYEENVNDRLFLVRGKDRGKAAWLYVLVKRTVFPLFLRRTQGGSLNVANFGQVLKSGWGEDPPGSVRVEFAEKAKTFPDIHSLTVLHVASKSSSPEIVELLVKYNADINGCDGDGFTPLHLAAIHGNFRVVKKLVELNADVNLKVDGKDAADLAHMNEETEIEEFLISKRSFP
ncbi:serine/threonine-protein phosphatase 6 regulatory ankyrin repeat subunit C-like [Stylophora pistillata]|uniref:serine/threonine-protein phosphatase 6 regulatory ankyrin repeat subunit C-like n=1 Tax=Stylophora pistillata TaxID=50429 RepID=UPI000C054E2C|nr:serine/threonine-protein phosphatase 6 regulatory ankyrin repeat subunit C-like [Stylophora pistillata]